MDIPIIELVGLGLLGSIAGFLNVMAGGGSLLILPALVFMDIPAPVANGTNRIGILFQNIFAVYGFFKKSFKDFKLSFSLSLFACLGAWGGSNLGVKIDGVVFDFLLIFAMIAVMFITVKNKADIKQTYKPKRLILGHILMIAAGFWGGMIQVGTGFILMSILNKIMGMDLVYVNMHKVFIVLAYTVVSLIVFSSTVGILWYVGLSLAVGTSIGGYLGARISISKGETWIKRVLYVVLVLLMIKLLLPYVS